MDRVGIHLQYILHTFILQCITVIPYSVQHTTTTIPSMSSRFYRDSGDKHPWGSLVPVATFRILHCDWRGVLHLWVVSDIGWHTNLINWYVYASKSSGGVWLFPVEFRGIRAVSITLPAGTLGATDFCHNFPRHWSFLFALSGRGRTTGPRVDCRLDFSARLFYWRVRSSLSSWVRVWLLVRLYLFSFPCQRYNRFFYYLISVD